MRALGYPLPMTDRIPEITEARSVELGLGLQVVLAFSIFLSFFYPFFIPDLYFLWSMISNWIGA